MEFSGLTKNHAGGGRETGNQFGVALHRCDCHVATAGVDCMMQFCAVKLANEPSCRCIWLV